MNIGEQIRQARLSKGISKYAVEQSSGVKHQIISRVEKGENTTVNTIERVCDAIGCTLRVVDKGNGI